MGGPNHDNLQIIENRTFDEIELGDTATLERTLSREDIELFAAISGDFNPAHLDDEYAATDMFHKIVAHGMWGASLISALLGTKLPGPGTIYLEQTLHFRRPVTVGDTITASVTAAVKDPVRRRISFDCRCANQLGETVIEGPAQVMAPAEKVRRSRVAVGDARLHKHGVLFGELVARARRLPPLRVAVVHPLDRESILGVVQATREGLIVPVLVGPEERIRAVAAAHDLDIDGLPVVDAESSREAADRAVTLARRGEVQTLMKGSLQTDELMRAAVAPGRGLIIDRRMSHVFVVDVPAYPRPLFITDAALNVAPDLTAKRDIVQNAIDLAHAVGVATPRVAILSAVETVNPKLRASVDAAALAKMAERGQIVGGVVDGPLGFDNSVSAVAARMKGVISEVAGHADIVVVPDLESGNILVKQLDYLGDSQAAGISLGGRVPIALTSRADTALERVASCALAVLVAQTPEWPPPATPAPASSSAVAPAGSSGRHA